MELEAKIHELLDLRAQRRFVELNSNSVIVGDAKQEVQDERKPLEVLTNMKTITSRRGFLTQQLRNESLSQLKRWHIQLQLLEMDAEDANRADQAHVEQVADGHGSPQSPAEQSLQVFQRDRLCFDISFVASPARIDDLRQVLFDKSDRTLRASEALAFSSTKDGYTVRVVLFTDDRSGIVHARSSLFLPGLPSYVAALGVRHDCAVEELLTGLWTGASQE